MFVKICGITNEQDALLAVAMGADAVGFVFAPSPRQIAPNVARDIARRLPAEIMTVGVFRDEAPKRILEIVNTIGIKGVQLHGHELPREAAWLSRHVPFVVQAFAAGDRMLDRADEYAVDALMIDSAVPGSGTTFDWSIAEAIPDGRRFILAGGLTPENVADAIARLAPWGVDVSSGVESSPGHKDPIKVMRFVNAAKAAGGQEEVFDLGIREVDSTWDLDGYDDADLFVGTELYDYDWEDEDERGG